MIIPQNDVNYFYWKENEKGKFEVSELCQFCGSDRLCAKELALTRYYVCDSCFRARRKFFRKITQQEALQKYGLSLAKLRAAVETHSLAREVRETKLGRKVHLYFEFQVKDLIEKLFGSLQNWERLRAERDAKKRRTLAKKIAEDFSLNQNELWSALEDAFPDSPSCDETLAPESPVPVPVVSVHSDQLWELAATQPVSVNLDSDSE